MSAILEKLIEVTTIPQVDYVQIENDLLIASTRYMAGEIGSEQYSAVKDAFWNDWTAAMMKPDNFLLIGSNRLLRGLQNLFH